METDRESIDNRTHSNRANLTLYGIPDQSEEPMDLTFSQKQIKIEMRNDPNDPSQFLGKPQPSEPPKKRGRKRKDPFDANPQITTTSAYDSQDCLQSMDNRQTEVLMAAKSLFSKRTRTLYHWMYPNTPKAQLKTAVSLSWETLGVQEKEFYVSQVLGRFGFPQCSLMVNPQLGGLRGFPAVPPLDLSSPTQANLETRNAVSTILENPEGHRQGEVAAAAGCSWHQQMRKMGKKKGGRIGRPPGAGNPGKVLRVKSTTVPAKAIALENVNEDFQDDPELRKEFEQFKLALHMSDKRS